MKMPLHNFSDPRVMGAACAAVDEITAMSNSVYKSVLILITNGTYQVSKLLCLRPDYNSSVVYTIKST